MKILVTSVCLFISTFTYALPLPEWAKKEFEKKGLKEKFELADFIRPAQLEADFNGDGRMDIAFLVVEKQSGKKGIIILHQNDPVVYQLGAGSAFGDGGEDFAKMQAWSIAEDVEVRRNERIRRGIEVSFPETGSAVIIFDGQDYNWQVQEG
jgi:hypothetical protein